MDPEELLDIVEQYEALMEQIYIPYAYASLSFSADTQSGEALNMLNRIQQVGTEAQNRVLFFSLWWKELDDETAATADACTARRLPIIATTWRICAAPSPTRWTRSPSRSSIPRMPTASTR